MLASLEGASQVGELICRFQWLVIHKDVWLVIHISRCRQGMTSVFSVLMVKQTDKLATNHVQGVLSGDPAWGSAYIGHQPREQAGFRSGFSTIDHIQVITHLQEKADEYKIPICFAFVDYEKAFDSIEFNPLFDALENQGVEAGYITLDQSTEGSETRRQHFAKTFYCMSARRHYQLNQLGWQRNQHRW